MGLAADMIVEDIAIDCSIVLRGVISNIELIRWSSSFKAERYS